MAIKPDLQTLDRPGSSPGLGPLPHGGFHSGYGSHLDESEIIRQFVPLVKRLALRLKGRIPETVQLDDLIQAGLIAVLRLTRHAATVPSTDEALQRSIVNAMIDEARREVWAPVRTVPSLVTVMRAALENGMRK